MTFGLDAIELAAIYHARQRRGEKKSHSGWNKKDREEEEEEERYTQVTEFTGPLVHSFFSLRSLSSHKQPRLLLFVSV